MRYVYEKSTSNKCEKADVFSAYNIISEVLLIWNTPYIPALVH